MNTRKIERASLTTRVLNQTITFDVRQHFPTYREYEVHNLADSVQATLKQPVVLKLAYAS